ncbi:hypothetical protein SEVIR_6G193000v4 [Setaria viridis]|uniref:BHLH domain-containing protein n=1 Tax=Setaria viridis TaxID=4556 RepID=A0A4U6UA78_SETVI|nr:transcription factor bHLH94-like [Setaria viridis]TKW10823.1 hypothetical protein SEVIR_6G193000v2 [Setaria viridis]
MALEAVVFCEGLFGSWAMAAAPGGGGGWSWGHDGNEHGGAMEGMMDLEGGTAAAYWEVGASSSVMMKGPDQEPDGSSAAPPPPENGCGGGNAAAAGAGFSQEVLTVATTATVMSPPSAAAGRRKRRRTRSVKNMEEVESQRMTHIAVERNRRKQMNEYLAVLRSLMPASYVQRGDQASIIGGAINYVKELEQLLQSLEARKHARRHDPSPGSGAGDAAPAPFAGFFTFPQYSMSAGARSPAATADTPPADDEQSPNNADADGNNGGDDDDASGSRPSSVAEVEVTMVESHANLKLLSRRRPRQLLRLVAGLQGHRLSVLHLNATSDDARHMALYSLSLKVEDDCALSSVDDIAAAVHRIVEAIDQEEGGAELRSQAEE